VLFIQPGRVSGSPAELDPARGMTAHPGVAYVAAAARRAGHEVAVLDAWTARLGLREVVRRAVRYAPDVVAFTAATPQVSPAAVTAAALRRALPRALMVVGGAHPSALPEQTLVEFPPFDAVVAGEGELAFVALLARRADPEAWREVPGVCFRRGEAVVRGPERTRILDLDALPFPAFDLFDLDGPSALYSGRNDGRSVTLTTARGCPYRCTFCQNPMGLKYRARSIESIIDEIRWVVRTFGVRRLTITDETFSLDRARTVRLCEAMLRADVPRRLAWSCLTRSDAVDPELLRLLRRAGCDAIFYGIETGDPEVMTRAQKRIDVEQTVRAVRWSREAGLFVHANVILGLPGETRRTARETIAYALRVDPDACGFNVLTPWPGTAIYEAARRHEQGLRLRTTDWTHFGVVVGGALELDTLPWTELELLQLYAYARFYLRPSKAANLVKIGDPRDIPAVLVQIARDQAAALLHRARGARSR
jgi:radical SAM superfamily enzyme YgiQ (UPF0313 family)